MLTWLYTWKLSREVSRGKVPEHIVLVLSEADILSPRGVERTRRFIEWCNQVQISTITIYVSVIPIRQEEIITEVRQKITRKLAELPFNINIYTFQGVEKLKEGYPAILNVSIGYNGKLELVEAFRGILRRVKKGELEPGDIDSNVIESHLLFKGEPDLVIRSGGKNLTDFLIWQSVYSELYFTEINWTDFTRVDFLRAVRDYQKRKRRYGR